MAFASWIRSWKRSLDRRWALYQTLRRKAVARRHAIRPHLETLEERFLLTTYLVTSTADTNTLGTLRYGINQANLGNYTEIDFNIGTTGSAHTISPTSQLPALTANGVFINGLSQGGSGNTTKLITLDGTSAGSSSDGLLLQGSGDSVSGLIIKDFHNGIEVAGITNTIGGTTTGAGNILSGNSNDGVLIDSGATGNQVQGNYIGINAAGIAQANSGNGVEIAGSSNTLGGTASGARNILSGNSQDGVLIDSGASSNQVLGNFIGTNASGIASVANINGIEVKGTGNTLGGTVAGSYNILSGNSQDGVLIDSGASGNAVFGNNIGININGNAALANNNGIEVAGSNNTLGTSYGVSSNVLSGNSNDGILLDSTASGNQVLGNYIGSNNADTVALANKVGIEDAGSSNTIGGSVLGDRNVISGNSTDGVLLDSTATAESLWGNNIGLNLGGTAALANGGDGVEVKGSGNDNGGNSGSNYFFRNFISGNGHDGVLIDVGATGNQVQGNFIGVGVSGTNGVGNAANGIEIQGNGNTLGGTTSGVGNVVSGNGIDGILVASMAANNLVQGNEAGTDYTGRVAVANSGNGVEIVGTGNSIGGTASGARNILSGNGNDGVLIDSSASGTLVQGNYIGINYISAALGNGSNGVEIAASTNSIGGSVSGARNIIAYNLSGGVFVSAGSGNSIRQNSLFANGSANTGPGITLASGANNNLAAPTVLTATLNGTTLTVTGTYNAPTAHVSYVLEFFANPKSDAEGKIYFGSLTVTPTSTGTQNFTFTTTNTSQLGTYPLITATLTDPSGDTSQISTVPSLYVLDLNTGETIPANATLNSFSGWSEDLLAQVSGATNPSYSWSLTNAPDFTVSGSTTTDNLQGSWTTFTSGTRTDTISVTETPTSGSPLTVTFSFQLSNTNSPAYSSRPTTSSTWPTVITPDQLSSGQDTQAAGPYASIGLADGSVQTAFSMPSYNPNTRPVSLDYISTAANAQPIFLAEYQLPTGQSVPSTISAQLTFHGTALATVTYNTSGLNPGDYVQIALQANATGLSTGRYPWSMTVTNGSTPTTYSGNVDIVNQKNSPYGAGWSLSNVEQLVSVSGGEMVVNPGGTSLFFASNGQGGYTTPAGDFSTLTVSGGVYTRTMPDGTKLNFNSSGQETSIADRDGNTTTFAYNGSGQVTTLTDMNNQVTTLAYNASGLLSTITDPANRTATLTYTGTQLTSITNPANDVWQYGYDSANDMTRLTDPNNNATTFTYNSADRIASVTNADSTTEQLSAMQMNGWAAAGSSNVTAVLLAAGDQGQYTDPRSNVWHIGIDWLGFGQAVLAVDPLGDTTMIYRDANGLPWLYTYPMGGRTRRFFDNLGNPTKIVLADDSYLQYQYNGFSEPTVYTDPTGDTTTYTYNSKGDRTQQEDALLNVWTYTYNSHGFITSMEDPRLNTTTYAYNSLNELTTITNALNQTTTYTYNSAGQTATITDARGFSSTFAYDAMNDLIGETLADTSTTSSVYTYTYDKVGNLTSVKDPLLHTTTYTYNKMNLLSSVEDALQETTTYTYDAYGNLTSIVNPLSQTTTYGYDADNRLTTITNALNQTTTIAYDANGEKTSSTDPLGHTTSYTYTQLGQLASATDALGDFFEYTYDSFGDQLTITQGGPSNPSMTASMVFNADHELVNYIDPMSNTYTYTYDGDGNQTSVTDPNRNTTTYIYNQINQLTNIEDALTNIITYGYDADGNRTTVTDPLGRTITAVYDAQGRALTVTNPLSGVVAYTYDLAGNETSIEDPDKYITTYTYDAVNRLSSTINPMGYTATYDYNAGGEVTTMTDADGRTITYSYDAVGRQTGESWVNGGYTATWTYDLAGNLFVAQDTYSKYSYGYDAANRWTSVSNSGTPGVPQVTLTYSYDNYNDLTGMTDSLGYEVIYSFNNDKLLTGIKMMSSGVSHTLYAQVTFGYDAASRLTGITRSPGDSIVTTLSYDNANRLTNMATADTLKHLSLANYTYGYDKASQLTSYQDNSSSSLTYSYDNNGELTGASGTLNGSSYAVTYSYDANGNRNMTGYTTGTGNELTSDGTYSYTYDHVGNITSQTNKSTGYVTYYTWDYRNRLTEVKQEDNHATVLNDEKFTYDVNNNRIAVSLNGTTQLYTVYDGSNPYMDFNGSGTLTERYLYNPNALNQFYGQVNAGGTAQWFLTDNINSIRQVVSTSGSVLDTITYDPFGTIVNQTNASNAPRFLYAGGALDSITGGYGFGRREENPAIGRWTSQDPLGLFPDSNSYRYVYNDPTILTDETGEESVYVYNWDTKNYQFVTVIFDGGNIGGNQVVVIIPPKPPPWWKPLSKPTPPTELDPSELPDAGPLTAGSLPNILNPNQSVSQSFKDGLPTIIVLAQVGMIWDSSAGMWVRPGYNPSGIFRGRPGGGVCFPAGTLVHTVYGLKAIEKIAVGDRVWAYDHRNLSWAEREVLKLFKPLHRGTMATIQVKGETIRATGGHPFWVVRGEGLAERPLPKLISAYEEGGRQEGRWVLACDLRVGDEVLLRQGEITPLESVQFDDVEERVYNFHVAELQNYAVGGCGVLVHNTNEHVPPSSRPTKVDPDTKLDAVGGASQSVGSTPNPNIRIISGKFWYRWPDGGWRTMPPPGGPLPPSSM